MPQWYVTAALVYIGIISLLGFALMGIDKKKAAAHERRIPEKILFQTAFIGGSPGVFLGIWVFRHKTRHLTFTLGIPFIILLQALAAVFIFWIV